MKKAPTRNLPTLGIPFPSAWIKIYRWMSKEKNLHKKLYHIFWLNFEVSDQIDPRKETSQTQKNLHQRFHNFFRSKDLKNIKYTRNNITKSRNQWNSFGKSEKKSYSSTVAEFLHYMNQILKNRNLTPSGRSFHSICKTLLPCIFFLVSYQHGLTYKKRWKTEVFVPKIDQKKFW